MATAANGFVEYARTKTERMPIIGKKDLPPTAACPTLPQEKQIILENPVQFENMKDSANQTNNLTDKHVVQ